MVIFGHEKSGRVTEFQCEILVVTLIEVLREWSFFNNRGGGVGGFSRERVEKMLVPPVRGVEIFSVPPPPG